ncbi:MAG: hypothetical protein VKM98_03910 [Cyanobacteriota bacterium]|nr:hypothetical protein [Cyanobacteriota bacterium]
MPDPQSLPQQDRPDPAVLLIDAVINRQDDLARRLSQQLVHRRGVEALELLIETDLLQSCGEDGRTWLKERLNAAAAETIAPASPRALVGTLIKEAVSEALAPLRQEPPVAAIPAPQPNEPAANPADPWALPPLRVVPTPQAAAKGPAPRPADLAELRAWLHSDAA